MITINEAVSALHGSEYPNIGNKDLFAGMKEAGLVAVFGHSDDCMEFRGAIYDEFYGTVHLNERGIIRNRCEEGEDCPNWRGDSGAHSVEPVFDGDPSDPAWVFKTAIPHSTFEVMEDGEVFQRGLVFALADAAPES